MAKYLDYSGLSEYDRLIKALINSKTGLDKLGTNPETGEAYTSVKDYINDLLNGTNGVNSKIDALESEIGEEATRTKPATGLYKYVDDEVAAEIAKILNGAPEDFDTLKEIADWIANSGSDAADVITKLEGGENVEGSVANALKQAKEYTDALKGGATTETVKSLADKLANFIAITNDEIDSLFD